MQKTKLKVVSLTAQAFSKMKTLRKFDVLQGV